MTFTRRNACLALIAVAAHPAWAQTYPSKPVTIVVPQAPGGTNDALGRILAQKLTERLGPVSYTHLTLPTKRIV